MIRLVRESIDVASLMVPSRADGAVCLFLGVVRNENAGRAVLFLEYEAYPEMALAEMESIAQEVLAKWPTTGLRLVHRLGRVEVGEPSVAIAVTAPHRKEAFEACRFVIDELKRRVPIWKKEFFADGAVWREGPDGSSAA